MHTGIVTPRVDNGPMHLVISASLDSNLVVTQAQADWSTGTVVTAPAGTFDVPGLIAFIAEREPQRPRWVWADSKVTYADLYAHGVRVERAHDLRLSREILRNSSWVTQNFLPPAGASPDQVSEIQSWDLPPAPVSHALFQVEARAPGDCVLEFKRQVQAVASAAPSHSGKLRFLLAAESAGGLTAVEMTSAGVPWDVAVHDQILTEQLGPRAPAGTRPAKLEILAAQIRELLDSPHLNTDSPKDLLAALQQAGLPITSTSKWEIKDIDHPVIPVLLDYKRRARMLTANGWAWQDQWVTGGRFRPVYVPGGVVTGRWGADGGGALQLPHFVRPAVVADPGWTFVLSDAAQLEPRILTAMSGDRAMALAGRGHDLYEGIKEVAHLESRDHAKFGMLGAMYGGTTGISAQVLPRFKVAFPTAMEVLERSARAGERGQTVHTWLGRTSAPSDFGTGVEGDDPKVAADRRQRTRSYGRFTRNFIVQGSAAEWALVWMALVRQELFELTTSLGNADPVSGPHLVFFLHDEILIHTPSDLAPHVAQLVQDCAAQAGQLLFGDCGVEFPVSAHINTQYLEPA